MNTRSWWLAYGLVLVGVLARLLPHPPNLTPLVAVALFAGAVLPQRWGLLVPLAAMIISDVAIGLSTQVGWNWAGFALVACLGWWLRDRRSVPRIATASVTASTLFFALSNFGVWWEGQLYPLTWAGLRDCYVAGIPFYRNMLAGDLVYVALLFGGLAWVSTWQRQPAIASSN